MSDLLNKIADAVYEGDEDLVVELANQAVEEGVQPEDIINQGGVIGLERLGEDFNNMEVFLPELMLGGDAMHALLAVVTPLMLKDGQKVSDTVIIGCAQGDLHDIGLNLVATQLAVGGYNVINLGTDTSVAKFIEEAVKADAKIIGVSSLLTTSAYYQDELVKALEKQGLRDKFKVIVGGGPITPEWAEKIGADGYSRTAIQAVELCNKLMNENPAGLVVVQ